ncbi:Rha family transcriptional regulator [Tissierella praeacuta]|uniref:Rha family transcriptional regulator n=1 Tax=Tissierella praeacuta TaxID=43131 RepID=UPI00334036B8
MDSLVVVKKNDIFTDSLIIAEGTGYEHHTITRKIRDYIKDFEELGKVEFMDETSINPKGGRPTRIYLLNEPQASYLITLLENNVVVRKFKLALVKEFYRMRQFIIEKQSAEWKESRSIGKKTRKDETDVIMTKLIPLAESQGSKNAGKLYMTYSKLVNSTLNIEAGQRDNLPLSYIDAIRFLERAIENIISIEVDKGTHYKEIYQICKAKCNIIKELAFLPSLKQIA